jgi:hypothetical protein
MAGVWGGTWSRVRCIGGPSAVCASLRTHVVSPVAQVRACFPLAYPIFSPMD